MTLTGAELPEFSRLLLKHRRARGWSQRKLADLAGCSDSYIALIETGRRGDQPSRDIVLALAHALGLSDRERIQLLRAAGRDLAADSGKQQRQSFESFVETDPRLTSHQKRLLIDLYHSWL